MKRNKTSKAWLHEHLNDTYVLRANAEGYRARAAYKLMEIDDRDHLIRSGETVVDLGATPGGWSQVAAKRMHGKGRVIALDLLEMDPLHGVDFIQGDFREEAVLNELEKTMADKGMVALDVVISDMAPNLSGIDSVDAARISLLVELAVDFSKAHLKPDGALVVKLFHGGAYDPMVALFRQTFRTVKAIKPKASREKSSETFLVGMGLKSITHKPA